MPMEMNKAYEVYPQRNAYVFIFLWDNEFKVKIWVIWVHFDKHFAYACSVRTSSFEIEKHISLTEVIAY